MNMSKAISQEAKQRVEELLLHEARLLGHKDPKEELEHGLHSLVNNLLIDLMHYCGEPMMREQLEEAAQHHQTGKEG